MYEFDHEVPHMETMEDVLAYVGSRAEALEALEQEIEDRVGNMRAQGIEPPKPIEKIDFEKPGIQAVALTPTRELALQVSKEITELGQGRGVKVETIYGGDSMERQLDGTFGPQRHFDRIVEGIIRSDFDRDGEEENHGTAARLRARASGGVREVAASGTNLSGDDSGEYER